MIRNTNKYILIALSVLLVMTAVTRAAVVSEQCITETQELQDDEFLDTVQEDLYNAYLADYHDKCDVTQTECSLKFDGDNATYVGACERLGGQVLKQHVEFECLSDFVSFDLGVVPTCIGISCNATELELQQLNDTRVEQFLSDLKLTGCEAGISAAFSVYDGHGGLVQKMGGMLAATTTAMIVGVCFF